MSSRVLPVTEELMGVDDPGSEASTAGPYFELFDRPGTPMIGWRVRDGVLVHETVGTALALSTRALSEAREQD